MPFRIDASSDILHVTLFGILTNSDLLELGRVAQKLESTRLTSPHRITDTADLEGLEITFDGVYRLAHMRLQRSFPNRFKSALVAKDDVHYGFARMFQTLNDHPQIAIAIFSNDIDARAWILADGFERPPESWAPPKVRIPY